MLPYLLGTDIGPLIDIEAKKRILKHLNRFKEKILFNSELDKNLDGFFIQPTIIEGLDYDCSVNQEEIFGPVVSIIPFKTEEEVIAMANSTKYGLSASIFTENVSKAHRVAASIDSGVIWINTWLLRDLRIPFGGMKSSGLGREGGFKSLKFFTEPKNICVKI